MCGAVFLSSEAVCVDAQRGVEPRGILVFTLLVWWTHTGRWSVLWVRDLGGLEESLQEGDVGVDPQKRIRERAE